MPVVCVDVSPDSPAMSIARQQNVPTIAGDMVHSETLQAANVAHARNVIICSGDDLANLEGAIGARALNKEARIYVRACKEEFAERIREAMAYDIELFGPYAVAARMILADMGDGHENWPPGQ